MGSNREAEKLSRREALAVQGVASGLTATEALVRAGYSNSVAHTRQKDVLGKPRVLRAIEQAMEEAGIGPRFLALTLRRGLTARRGVYHEGKLVASEPDHGNRHRFLRTALELRGDLRSAEVDEGDSWDGLVLRMHAQRRVGELPKSTGS